VLCTRDCVATGVAVSRDGISWSRGFDAIEGSRGEDAAADVGRNIDPNGDWWTFDTCHLAPGDVQASYAKQRCMTRIVRFQRQRSALCGSCVVPPVPPMVSLAAIDTGTPMDDACWPPAPIAAGLGQ
jgi:hypothetical protein